MTLIAVVAGDETSSLRQIFWPYRTPLVRLAFAAASSKASMDATLLSITWWPYIEAASICLRTWDMTLRAWPPLLISTASRSPSFWPHCAVSPRVILIGFISSLISFSSAWGRRVAIVVITSDTKTPLGSGLPWSLKYWTRPFFWYVPSRFFVPSITSDRKSIDVGTSSKASLPRLTLVRQLDAASLITSEASKVWPSSSDNSMRFSFEENWSIAISIFSLDSLRSAPIRSLRSVSVRPEAPDSLPKPSCAKPPTPPSKELKPVCRMLYSSWAPACNRVLCSVTSCSIAKEASAAVVAARIFLPSLSDAARRESRCAFFLASVRKMSRSLRAAALRSSLDCAVFTLLAVKRLAACLAAFSPATLAASCVAPFLTACCPASMAAFLTAKRPACVRPMPEALPIPPVRIPM